MKSRLWLISLVALAGWLREVAAVTSNCQPPFQEVPYSNGTYCAKCDTTCLTCLGSSINQCSTCPTDFTLDSNTSTCIAPISSSIDTIANSYHSFNFISEWSSAVVGSCGSITLLKPNGPFATTPITTTHTLAKHYKIRVRVAFWSITNQTEQLGFTYNYGNGSYIDSNLSSVTVNSHFAAQSYQASCDSAYALNYEYYVDDSTKAVSIAQVKFTSSAANWGINQYIFIAYLCYQPDCASCSGPNANQCLSCADSNKALYATPGTCLCNFTMGYYAYPTGNSTYYCVNPCPNLPNYQYYGDNFTKNCVLTCPADANNASFWGLTFASDVNNVCVKQCQTSITLGGTSFPLYFDLVGRKCTTKCPAGQPYSNSDRACYSACPINSGVQYYMLDLNYTCVQYCPNITNSSDGVQIPLFRDPTTLKCVQSCPAGYWGYTNSSSGDRYCSKDNCPNGTNQFTDNSTGRPLCTITCAAPNWFGDYYLLPAVCTTSCSFPNFGDQNDTKRYCVPKCNGSYFGIQSGTRQCVSACPQNSWGERLKLVCITAPKDCNLINITFSTNILPNVTGSNTFDITLQSYADNYTHMCIWANESCSNGMFKLNTSLTCELACPSGTYANTITYWCVDFCYGSYFADPQLNQCVLLCSPGLYADIGSSNKCVTKCNQTGGYPYRDEDLRQCVNVCSNGYADPIAQSCVFNCTPGLYINGSDQSNQTYKFCVENCTSPYFAYNNTDSGICLQTCPSNPILFGDVVGGLRICVEVCLVGEYGDQTNNSYRHCVTSCPNNTFAQNDTLRRCVTRCNVSTYGRTTDWTCVDPLNCPFNFTGDPTTNLCVDWCPTSSGTYADNASKLCVSKCPNVTGTVYYADSHIRWCIPSCIFYNSSVSEFGNNSTQTCESKCLDNNSFADAQSPRRYCIALCTNTNTSLYYRNNFTMTCVVSTGCNSTYFADNLTAYCVEKCPIIPNSTNSSNSKQSWGYWPTQTCVALCLPGTFGDASSGIPQCVSLCAEYPVPKWSYLGPNDDKSVMLCMTVCPPPYFGEDFLRTCVTSCPRSNGTHNQTYSYDITRRCLLQCPASTFADYIDGICYHYSINCTIPCWYSWTNCSTYRWGDPYNNSCTYLCTASPWDTYGDNTTQTCTTLCAVASYADNYTGTRTCIATCPGYYDAQGVVNATKLDIRGVPFDSYGDNYTQRCVQHCITPSTYADWQTHVCTLRCTGDLNTTVPTYANIFTKRCVIALFCPETPDKYFGENVTRLCQPSCILNSTNVSFADNITRTCIPVCYQFYNNTSGQNLTTMFYGDITTGRPACVIACSTLPREFGRNDTNLCVAECPNFQYGDQTGNRSCVPVCPNINGVTWFSQLTERICVTVCEDGTWGNYYNSTGPHCETVGTDCKKGQFGDNSTHLCVDLCPESMNYFGDPRSRLCTDRCPFLNSSFSNTTANITLDAGRLFADYKTRLCVYTCPADFGLQGTYGDNSTNTCVERCPEGSFGDANTVNRFCVATCTGGAYADPLSMLCVDICPASPPLFGYAGNWTCLETCPNDLWADSTSRTCASTCSPDFRLNATGECVSVCPAQLDLYGDSNGFNCTAVCTLGQFADPTDRTCKAKCLPLFQYNYRCVIECPVGLFANSTGDCVPPLNCDNNTFGDNSTTKCVNPCPAWSFADSASGYCIAICPSGTYGSNYACVSNCTATNTSYSNITQQCMSICPNGTYSLLNACVPNCTGSTYQREDTRICDTSCKAGLWADPTTHRCVATCPYNWFRQSYGPTTGSCVPQSSGCAPLFADFYTGNCVTRCSTGFWGFKNVTNGTDSFIGNYTCNAKCPGGLYGYENGTERICYPPNGLPSTSLTLFGDSISGQFVAVCPTIPVLYYGDANRQLCVVQCQSFNLTVNTPTLFYGDPQARQCKSTCTNTSYTADNITHLCTLRCSLGTFRYNITPVCVVPCFDGFGDSSTRTCVAVCPAAAGTFGFYNTTSGSRLCVYVCPQNYYAEPLQRTCTALCPSNSTLTFYAYNDTRECVLYCKDSFADKDLQRCVSQCKGNTYPNADNSTNRCVTTCPSFPDYYADNRVCVFYCVTPNTFADRNGRICTTTCSNLTGNQYGDPRTGRCEFNCSEGTWGDNSSFLCVSKCPTGSFADNTTGVCVAECPKVENIYADMVLNVCAYTCSYGFGSQLNQTCVNVCEDGYWGDPTTTLCTKLCPVKIYSFGQNRSRTCVQSCQGYPGYADNYSRLCREYCQHNLTTQTYIDYTTYSCVEICPQGYWAANYTASNNTVNQCVQKCPSGFADNFSQWCVAVCPSDPESYGDTHSKVCIYSCLGGEFSDNSTNLCVGTCPSLNSTPPVDYYGDPASGRCVLWCTEGTYAQNSSRRCVNPCDTGEFADNLTRRCVLNCPPSEWTFADSTTHRCVRICPPGWYAENTTQACVQDCWTYTSGALSGIVGYADNLTNFCVAQCPFGYFGTNSTHKCVLRCPSSLNQFGHFIGRVCVGTNNGTGVVNCYKDNSTNITFYGDPTSQTCVQKCPLTLWANTHINKCVDTCDSTIPEFRNNHTQMCVWPCPSNPDEFADPRSGNCVRTCPVNSYAYTVNRTCQDSCAPFLLFADNTTNRCEPACATLPYLFADNLTYTCVFHCSGGQFADNRSQSCVPVCPVEWAYFGETHSYTCVSLCPDGEFADANALRTCRTTCTNNFFADNYTSTCVQHCRFVRPFWYEHIITLGNRVCVDVCPGESYAYNPDQTCKYQDTNTLASTCPSPYFADRASKQCVKFCPAGTFANSNTRYCQPTCSGTFYADPILRTCALNCSGNLFEYVLNASSNQCVQYCPYPLFARNASTGVTSRCVPRCSNLGLPSSRTCENYCPHPYFADWPNNLCVLACTPTLEYMPNRTCLGICEPPYYGNPVNFTCDLLCPEGYFGRNDTQLCDTQCPNNSYADPSIRICVSHCPGSPLLYADSRTNKCLSFCLSPLFGYEVDLTCRSSCPNLTVGSKTYVYLADASNRLCVLGCVNAVISFADYKNNVCTQFCPSGTFANNFTKECVPTCPKVPNDTFSDNTSHICMEVCQPGSFGMASTLNCVANCWWPFYADPTTRKCVDFCPLGYFAENFSATCRPSCPPLSYADPVTHRCLVMCPAQQFYFNFAGNWTCILSCPSGFFANTMTNTCESICNSSTGMFAYLPTKKCVQECPVPYRGFAPNYTCVLECPSQYYFYDVTINVCSLCDPTCIVCSSVTTCLQCKSGYNLFSGYCSRSCIPTGGVITYADPGGICVKVCPITYFGDSTTYSCTQTCPVNQFGNAQTSLCEYCPPTCASCTSATLCLSCTTAATLAIDNMCYRDCNATFKYAYNGSCYNICPGGSYLTYTGVTCASCGPLCLTCTGTPTTCTSCATTYYFNGSCLTKCPSGYYGSTTLQCLTCSNSNNSACTNPLTFSTSFSTQNYQPVITLQFSQNVTMSKDLSSILNINLNLARLLEGNGRWLSLGTIVNNGITFTYEILPNGTIRLYPEIGSSLVSPTFSVQISDPAAVISTQSGVSLQNVQSLLSIASLEYYSEENSTKAGTNFPATFVTVVVLLLYCFTFVFSDVMVRPLQLLQVLFFHCLITAPVPANVYYHLLQMRASTMHFLANWFAAGLPASSPYYSTPQKVVDVFIDEIFLRHLGQLFVLLLVLGCFWFVFLILSSKYVIRHKIWQGFFEEVSRKRYQLMVINDVFSLFYFPLIYFALMQFPTLFGSGGFYALNSVLALFLLLCAIIVPIAWAVLWKVRPREYVRERLWFLTLRVKSMEEQEVAAVHDEKSQDHLQEKSSHHSNQIYEPPKKEERNSRQLQAVVFLWYEMAMALWMVVFYAQPTVQLALLITTNCIFLIYNLKVRPQLNAINVVFTVFAILIFILFEAMYLYFINNGSLTANQKTNAAFPFLVTADIFCVLFVLWALWRCVWECSFYWNNFKKTLLYLEFADHDYVGEEEKTSEYSQYEQKAEKLEVGLGDLVIDEIIERVGPSGEKIIAVKKKRLRKKAKIQGRKKRDGAELLPQEDISSREEYVRVNQVNVFDYQDEFQEDPAPQPQARRRAIDDDVRDVLSENEQVPRYHSDDEEEKKIDVDHDQHLLSGIDLAQISAVQDQHASERISDYPFIEIEQQEEHAEEEKMGEEEERPITPLYPIQQHPAAKQQSPREGPEETIKEEEKPQQQEEANYQEIKSQNSNLLDRPFEQPTHPHQLSQQPHKQAQAGQPLEEKAEMNSVNIEDLPGDPEEEIVLPQPKIKNIDDLLEEEESGRKKNLLFLFDDFDEDEAH